MTFTVKICGINEPLALDAALDAGADFVGFVFFEKSPRHISYETARELGRRTAGRAKKVALAVDPDDGLIAEIIAALDPDLIQLHGYETPERVAEIRQKFARPVMKAIGISSAADLAAVATYQAVADWLLFDAKPPKDATRPGGLGKSFDWHLLAGLDVTRPAMLSGGLDPDNVAAALEITRLAAVDVSSGVESAPGRKDANKIARFVENARRAAVALGLADRKETP